MSEQNDDTGVRMPPQGSSEGKPATSNNPVDRWLKRKAEEDAKRPNPLADIKGDA